MHATSTATIRGGKIVPDVPGWAASLVERLSEGARVRIDVMPIGDYSESRWRQLHACFTQYARTNGYSMDFVKAEIYHAMGWACSWDVWENRETQPLWHAVAKPCKLYGEIMMRRTTHDLRDAEMADAIRFVNLRIVEAGGDIVL